MSKKLSPFHTDQKTAEALVAIAKQHVTQPIDSLVTGIDAAGVTTQFQNTCQFKLSSNWQTVKNSTQSFVASGEKIATHQGGAEKRNYSTTIYAYGDQPTSGKNSIIAATRRANRWVLLPTGTGVAAPGKARLVQPKELFSACEYKNLKNVFGCLLEYSDDGESWIPVGDFHCGTRDVVEFYQEEFPVEPHKYWRVNLKGFSKSKPEDPNDENADRGFYTFGRLWESLFWVERNAATKKTVIRQTDKDKQEETEYIFFASVPDHWSINAQEPLAVELSISPSVENGKLFYKASTGQWKSFGAFESTTTVFVPTHDIQITIDEKMGKERYNTSFQFRVEQTAEEYNPAFDEAEKESEDNPKFIDVMREVGNLTLKRPTYKLSPERPGSFTVTRAPVVVKDNDHILTAKPTVHWKNNSMEVSVTIKLHPPTQDGILHYRPETEVEWRRIGEIYDETTVTIPTDDLFKLQEPVECDCEDPENCMCEPVPVVQNTFFEFGVSQYGNDVISVIVPKPPYPILPGSAEVALPPPREDVAVEHLYFDSKPVPRKAQNHRYWTLTFDEPEVVTKVLLDVDRHREHYIIAPGGRDANKQDIPFIYSFDFTSEQWTAATFPAMIEPMRNMDAKVVELKDETHQLMILSGQSGSKFSNVIQGYNFERDTIKAPVDLGELGINFAGRPALVGDPMMRNVGTSVLLPEEETDFSRSLMVIGGGERSVAVTPGGSGNSTLDSVLFSVRGETLALGSPYRIQTQNMAISNIGHTGLPFGRYEYRSYVGSTNDVVTRLQNMGTYTRHQNLPVRGILRRRPLLSNGNVDTLAPSSSKPVVDFLLIGGFNEGVHKEERNRSVVSGIFNAMTWSASGGRTQTFYSMAIKDVTEGWDSFADRFIYYASCKHILGDCCAEYVYETDEQGNVIRDEIICFGGRSLENDTAVAHEELAVLDFTQSTPQPGNLPDLEGKWLYGEWEHEYPPMPHPRWSAASVLIKDLVRTGETEPCSRIFIIGGRNRDGFVAEVDVFNLRYNIWEIDWKGLLEGELETVPASLVGGSGTTIVIGGGGNDCKAISNARIDQILQAHGF